MARMPHTYAAVSARSVASISAGGWTETVNADSHGLHTLGDDNNTGYKVILRRVGGSLKDNYSYPG
jgi:hypothetical protein